MHLHTPTTFKKFALLPVALALASITGSAFAEDSIAQALKDGKVSGNLNLRYEGVEQDNALQDASAFTLRTRLGFTTGKVSGFSATIEMEDNRIVLGQDDYSVPPTGFNTGIYSVIADPEHTELDQGFIQFQQENVTVKVGRQVIAHDQHRFIGHVGWRQDRQTFDAATIIYAASDKLKLDYSYITQRNRIFAEAADLNSKDHLLHGTYQTQHGTFAAYSYLLEVDNTLDNALDTYGARFSGANDSTGTKLHYHVEYASQSSKSGESDFDANYLFLQAGATVSGITAKVGYEVLGSDEGAYGFQTPLATLHAFNGWADIFLSTPAQGLVDLSFTLTGNVLGGNWLAIYHDYEADEASETVDDLGSEINLQYTKKFTSNYSMGVKYAAYSGESSRIDTDKLWAWFTVQF